jgi:DNA-binding GntR family transcriptional regulator
MTPPLNKKDAALADLQARILKLDLAPGSALEEAPLCALYGLSRTPLREVLQRLAGMGFIALEAGRGAEVAPLDLSRIRQFFKSGPLLHSVVARQAAEGASAEGHIALRTAQANVVRARVARNAASMALADYQFHRMMCQVSGNPYIGPSLERLLVDQTRMSQKFWRATSGTDSARIEKAMTEHESLVEAIVGRNANRAVTIALAHWEDMRAHIEVHVQPAPLADEGGLLDGI